MLFSTNTANKMSTTKLQKILCLHGYRQNSTAFKDKTGSLRKLLKKHAEFVYINAPHLIPATIIPNTETVDSAEEQRSWYFSTEKLTFNSHDITEHCIGLEKSIKTVTSAFEELGPFDGILGFSQGAAFTALLCALHEKGELSFNFKFVILVSGFQSKLSPLQELYTHESAVPSMHIIGDTDKVVEKEMCEELLSNFKSPQVLHHGGGHYVPATSKEKQSYFSFLEQVQ